MGGETNKDRDKMTPLQKARIVIRLDKKAKELNKHYPNNHYEVKDNMVIRTKGVRPHKVSKKVKAALHAIK